MTRARSIIENGFNDILVIKYKNFYIGCKQNRYNNFGRGQFCDKLQDFFILVRPKTSIEMQMFGMKKSYQRWWLWFCQAEV